MYFKWEAYSDAVVVNISTEVLLQLPVIHRIQIPEI